MLIRRDKKPRLAIGQTGFFYQYKEQNSCIDGNLSLYLANEKLFWKG